MDIFAWNVSYMTGEAIVDAEHQGLFRLINWIIEHQSSSTSSEEIEKVLAQLIQYAVTHFQHEEALMSTMGCDSRFVDIHANVHAEFSLIVGKMHEMPSGNLEDLLRFLCGWLAQHILGIDQAMARQIRKIRSGITPSQAFEEEQKLIADPANTSLLNGMNAMFRLIAARNDALEKANATLAAEVAARSQQLLQSEKMAAIGQLAAGVAHEINNPVGFVNSNLGTLKTYTNDLLQLVEAYEAVDAGGDRSLVDNARKKADLAFLIEDLPKLLAESQDGLNRVTKIVQDLKDFSRIDQAEYQYANLNEALETTLNVVRNEIKYKADVVNELTDIPDVECIPAQINQVFMNLLVNAAQSIERHGRITIRSGQENDFVWFDIADTGHGMSDEVKNRIFEPFYTTKPVGKGTGLGLSISYDIIVKKHGGRFEVTSNPGQGTIFRLWLPVRKTV